MKSVVSYVLFGNSPKYWVGAEENAKAVREMYQGWNARFYIPKGDPAVAMVRPLKQCGAEVFLIRYGWLYDAMLYRLLVIDDRSVGRFMIRDCDSRIHPREVAAVQEWLATGKPVHCMRDHPHHSCTPMMGGMWGGLSERVRGLIGGSVGGRMIHWCRVRRRGNDQDFLRALLWPLLAAHTYQHDEMPDGTLGPVHPFPIDGGDRFVGEVFDEKNQPRDGDWQFRNEKRIRNTGAQGHALVDVSLPDVPKT